MKIINKITAVILLLAIAAVTSASCGSGNDDYEGAVFDIDKVAVKLLLDLQFGDELVALDREAADLKYNFGGTKSVIYAGSGATPEIVIAVQCPSRTSAEEVFKKIDAYITEQKKLFDDYNVNERPKLDKAFYDIFGNYVFCVVSASGGEAAEKIVKDSVS